MSNVTVEQMKDRTKQFALRTIKLYRALPKSDEARIIGKQVLRSSTSVAANYRASCRSRSDKEFLARISVVIEEADETAFWLELLADAEVMKQHQLTLLLDEANQLCRIFGATQKSLKAKLNRQKSRINVK